jgi:hypothetical protein
MKVHIQVICPGCGKPMKVFTQAGHAREVTCMFAECAYRRSIYEVDLRTGDIEELRRSVR